jgi:hypothetical protein
MLPITVVVMPMLVTHGLLRHVTPVCAAATQRTTDDALENMGTFWHVLRATAAATSAATAEQATFGSRRMARSAPVRMCAEEEEEDWVRARAEAEDRAFLAKREEARLARHAAWEEEKRILRAEEARRAEAEGYGGEAEEYGGEAEEYDGEVLSGQALADYEARMREATTARPQRTAEEKQEAYNRELLRQIEVADAMDERMRQRNAEARRVKGLEGP